MKENSENISNKLFLKAEGAAAKVYSGHLRMGGSNPQGCRIDANNFYFTVAGKPVLPVMGEFHFSRYPWQYWEEEILKMKACGINIIATYIFWIHHEEIEGQWDWAGDKNLRNFVKLCDKHQLYVFPRIGPYAHGECRNGGFPDWLWEMPNKRTDDPVYLSYAKKLYIQIFNQLKGSLYKDGGPVIGIQVENEYWFAKAGEKHMITLKNMAREIGFDVPLYTATGWKDASIPQDEFIPVFGGYADLPWELHTQKLPPMPEYFFHHIRNNEIMDEKFGLKENGYHIDFSRYPYATCELGAGIQITEHRRPIVSADDVCALSIVKLGSGSNLMGYFVFHGGTHPDGALTTMQEIKDRPYKLEYPVKSYDFQAPVGEFGQISESYRSFKIIHMFLNDFGNILAPMVSVLPEKRPVDVADKKILRFAARVKDDSGFLFFNNYQRQTVMKGFKNCSVELKLQNETLSLPQKPFMLENGKYFIWPFNFKADDVLLKYATTQLLCKIRHDEIETYFFFAIDGIEPQYVFDSKTVKNIKITAGRIISANGATSVFDIKPGIDNIIDIDSATGKKIRIITLTEEQAKLCWKADIWGCERLFITKANLLFIQNYLKVYGTDSNQLSFSVYPAPENLSDENHKLLFERNGIFTRYILTAPFSQPKISVTKLENEQNCKKWKLTFPDPAIDELNELFLRIHYYGDSASAYINGRLAADNFYNGTPWLIGLKRFAPEILQKGLILEINAMKDPSKIYLEDAAKMTGCKDSDISKIEIVPEFFAKIFQTHLTSITEKKKQLSFSSE